LDEAWELDWTEHAIDQEATRIIKNLDRFRGAFEFIMGFSPVKPADITSARDLPW
jgi:hypothetical protein